MFSIHKDSLDARNNSQGVLSVEEGGSRLLPVKARADVIIPSQRCRREWKL